MRGAFYCESLKQFLSDTNSTIRDALTEGIGQGFYQQLSSQTISWTSFINILKNNFRNFSEIDNSGILLEYPIPRRAKRIDAVFIIGNLIIVIEFKDGAISYDKSYVDQLEDYCLDLRDFHFESAGKIIIPILLCPDAAEIQINFNESNDRVQQTLFANSSNLSAIISHLCNYYKNVGGQIVYREWNFSKYSPTPTIIEAAQTLYAGQNVKEISRSHAGAENLSATTSAIISAIREAQESNSKIICFITGVPGAGKTLAGLNIVHNNEFKSSDKDLGVFLSGNSPLVKVLSEALSRDFSKTKGINKKEANRKVSTFIQNVHQFIDEYYEDKLSLPVDNVLIYDEAQRAWTKEYKYFKSDKRINASEPEILLSIMERFKNWAAIIALVGGGQEINTGEGGLAEWGKSLKEKFKDWKIYISPELKIGDHSTGNMTLFKDIPNDITIIEKQELHLKTSIRSYKAQNLSEWVNFVLDNKPSEAKALFDSSLSEYPIFLTRSLEKSKELLKNKRRGTRRSGMVASSGAKRLRAIGLDINAGLKGTSTQNELGAWYLNPSSDVRSSNFLEIISSEFGVQGLELDWACVCWDADLRRLKNHWCFRSFKGTKWFQVKQPEQQQYLLNTYRVLLTRAREGMIIFVPEGDSLDETRLPEFYDPIFDYLKDCGLKII